MSVRTSLAALGAALAAAGAFLSMGPPRLTLLNAALRVDYPPARALAAAACGAGLALAAWAFSRRALRLLVAAASLVALGAGLHLLLYRVEAGREGLAVRGLAGRSVVAWRDVTGLKLRPDAVLLEASGDRQLVLDTTDMSPDQRSTLERTLARHVREQQ